MPSPATALKPAGIQVFHQSKQIAVALRDGALPLDARHRRARDLAWAAAEVLAERTLARLAAMAPAERAAALRAAREMGDDALLGAVLAAPPGRSSVASQAEHDALRFFWRRDRHAAVLDRAERLGRAAALLAAHVGGLYDEGRARRAPAPAGARGRRLTSRIAAAGGGPGWLPPAAAGRPTILPGSCPTARKAPGRPR